MNNTLLYYAKGVLRKGELLPDDIREFIFDSLRLESPPLATVVVDCLLIVGWVLGIKLHIGDRLVADKGWVHSVCVRDSHETKLLRYSHEINVATLRSTESIPRGPRRVRKSPPPVRLTLLWNPCRSALGEPSFPKELRLVPCCHANSSFPRTVLTNGTNSCHGSRVRTAFSHSMANRGGQTRMGQSRRLCER